MIYQSNLFGTYFSSIYNATFSMYAKKHRPNGKNVIIIETE